MVCPRSSRGGPALLGLAVAAISLGRCPRTGRHSEEGTQLTFLPTSGTLPLLQSVPVSQPPAALPAVRVAAEPKAAARSLGGAALGAVAFAGALAALVRTRSPGAGDKSVVRVPMRANSPFPSTPLGTRGVRRIRAGPHRPMFGGRQLRVRVNPTTNKPIRWRMFMMAGDTVQVIKGKDKGKVTTVLKVYPKWNRILCLGVNYCIKHVRPQRQDEVGQRVQVEAPFHATMVMHYSEKEQVAGRIGIRYRKDEEGQVIKERYNKATGETIEVKEAPEWIPVLDRVNTED